MRFLGFAALSLLASVLGATGSKHNNDKGHSPTCQNNYDYDYILLAVQWPETFCETTQCIRHKDKWQIHGAWPENNDGSYPQNCCTDHHFDMKLMDAALVTRMVNSWGTLKAHGSNEEFWSHEYEKHATCAIKSPKLKTQVDYFKNTLDLFENQIHIEKWLSDAGIVPDASKTYKMTDVHAAIQKGLKHSVQITCTNSKRHHEMVFSQINFCINKDTLQPMDCPPAARDRGCNSPNIAYLPSENKF